MPELVIDPQDGTAPLMLSWQAGYGIQKGPLGLGLPPRRVVERVRGDGQGSDLLAVRIGPRDVTVPLDVYGNTRADFLQRRRRLQAICGQSTPTRPIRVTYREDDGRLDEWIEGVYVGGLEGDEATGDGRSELFAVVLRDGCPYWRAPRVSQTWEVERPPVRSWFPVLGSSPASSLVGGRRTVINPGDVEVRAPWVIQGPGSRLLLINHTAGWRVDISHPIPADGPSSLITITTERAAQSVRDGHDVNLFGNIRNGAQGGWEMGPLLPGPNEIEVVLQDSGPGSSVTLAYDPLLLTV